MNDMPQQPTSETTGPTPEEQALAADKARLAKLEQDLAAAAAELITEINATETTSTTPEDPATAKRRAFEQGPKKELELFFKEFWQENDNSKQLEMLREKFPELQGEEVKAHEIHALAKKYFSMYELDIPAPKKIAQQAPAQNPTPSLTPAPQPTPGPASSTSGSAATTQNQPPTTPPVNSEPAPLELSTTPDQRLHNRFVGKFVYSEDSGLSEIVTVIPNQNGTVVVRMMLPNGKTELKEFSDKQELVNSIVDRGERLQQLNERLQNNLKTDLNDMKSVKKTWLQIRKAIWSRGFAVGLSNETQLDIKDLNQYLDSLAQSAERRWRERNPDITDEEITNLMVRYKARFASGLQLQTEQAALEKMKDDAIDSEENRVTRTFHKAKEWWGTVKPWKKRALTYGIMAGTTALSLASGTALTTRLASMAGGMLTGMSVRGISDKYWESSEGAESIRVELQERQNTINTLAAEIRALGQEKGKGNDDAAIQEKQKVLQEKIKVIQEEIAQFSAKLEESLGRINSKRIELEKEYNNSTMPLGQFVQKDAALRAAEARADSIKKIIATAATIGVAMGIGASMNSFTDSSLDTSSPTTMDKTPIDTGTGVPDPTETIENPVMDPPSPLDPNYVEPEPIPFNPDYDEDFGNGGTDKPDADPIVETPDNKVLSTDKAGVGNGEGITHAFKHQLDSDPELLKIYEEKLGMDYESNKGAFLAKLAKEFGYIDEAGNDVRVSAPNVSAYQLNTDGSVSEFYKGQFMESHDMGSAFEKPVDTGREYLWDGSDQHQGGGGGGVEMETTPINPDGVQPETTPVGVEMKTTPTHPHGAQMETTPVVKASPENILSSTETTTAPETASTILDRIQGVNAAETESKLLGQCFTKNTDGHWVLKGTGIHFDDSISAEYSHADSPQYDPRQNIAKISAQEVFMKMDNNNLSAERFAKTATIPVSEATKLIDYFKQLQILQKDMNLTLATNTTFGDLTRDIINNANKA